MPHLPSTAGKKEPAIPHILYKQGLSLGRSEATAALHACQFPLPSRLTPLLLLLLLLLALNPTGKHGSCDCRRAPKLDAH
jgi:hypothetical protein